MDIDFNQNTVNDLFDKKSQFEIVSSFDFTINLDDKKRVKKNKIDNIELLEKNNKEQAF